MTDHDMLAIEARKTLIHADFVKPQPVPSRKVLQLVFEVPEEEADHAMAVLGGYPQSGQNRWCAIAQLTDADLPSHEDVLGILTPDWKPPTDGAEDKDEPSEATPEPTETGTADWSEAKRKMVQQSGIIRNEISFQAYVSKGWHVLWNHERHRDAPDHERAAYFIRTSCGVESCSDLDPVGPSGEAFRRLVQRYETSQEGRDQQYQDEREQGRR